MKDPVSKQQHLAIRSVLRTVGPILLLAGAVCMVWGLVDMFTAPGMPSKPWLMFVGMPLVFVGIVMTKIGYAGVIARYMGREITPAASHTFNDIAEGTTEGVRTVTRAIRDGLSDEAQRRCHSCDAENDADARFCDACGEPLATP